MGYETKRIILLVWLAMCTGLLVGGAAASIAQAYPYRDARGVRQVHTIATRLSNQLSEARHVERATKLYSAKYGKDVGRWVWLARDTGWSWGEMPTLMYIIHRESRGDPRAKNPSSTASGLLQFLAFHWDGSGKWRFDPYNPRAALTFGHKLYLLTNGAAWAV